MSIRLYVGNLPAEVDRRALETVFNESGEAVSLKVITDRKTGKCRGFAFITVGTDEVADNVIDKFNGYDFNGAVLKLEKALPRTKGEKGDDAQEGEISGEIDPGEETEESATEVSETPGDGDGGESKGLPNGSNGILLNKDLNREVNKDSARDPKPAKRNNKSKRDGSNSRSNQSSSSNSQEPHQPDPRWSQELEQLKQRLLEAQSAK
jgi:RNA recognition motif-containing protein